MKNEDLKIRLAEKEDIKDIVSLMRDGFSYITDKIIYGCDGINNFIEDNFDNETYAYVVAELTDKIIGAVEYRIGENEIILNYIVLDESLRGKKLSNLIFESSLTLLPAKNKIILDVFTSNSIALKWYEKIGFTATGIVEWNEIKLNPADNNISCFRALNESENIEKFNRYGFSMFQFTDGENNFEAGIMGNNWIRITDGSLLGNPEALNFLSSQFPERRIFTINQKNLNNLSHLNLLHIIDSQRMERCK